MGLIAWFKDIFSKKEKVSSSVEVDTKLAILKLGQDLHAQTITEIIERLKYSEEFKAMVANAFSNLDNRIDAVEKMASFLYEKAGEHEGRVSTLEDVSAKDEFHKLVNMTKD